MTTWRAKLAKLTELLNVRQRITVGRRGDEGLQMNEGMITAREVYEWWSDGVGPSGGPPTKAEILQRLGLNPEQYALEPLFALRAWRIVRRPR